MKRLTIAASSLIVLLAACEAPRDSMETTVQPTRVDVPSMVTQEVKPPRARGVAFRVATDPGMATTTTAPLLPPLMPGQTVPNIGGQIDPKGTTSGVQVPIEQPIFVVGVSQGKRPSAAVIGWTSPFVTVGDRLGKARVVKIAMDGVHLDDGSHILVTSSITAIAGQTTNSLSASAQFVPNIGTSQEAPVMAPRNIVPKILRRPMPATNDSIEPVFSVRNGNGSNSSTPLPIETPQATIPPMQ